MPCRNNITQAAWHQGQETKEEDAEKADVLPLGRLAFHGKGPLCDHYSWR
jgi:hypothetical protein